MSARKRAGKTEVLATSIRLVQNSVQGMARRKRGGQHKQQRQGPRQCWFGDAAKAGTSEFRLHEFEAIKHRSAGRARGISGLGATPIKPAVAPQPQQYSCWTVKSSRERLFLSIPL